MRLPNGMQLRPHLGAVPGGSPRMLCYRAWHGPQGLVVLGSSDDGPHGVLLHVSLSYRDRLPPWDVVRAVREAFYPDTVDVMMLLPRRDDYVNLHPYTFHLQQCPERWGIR